VQVTHRILIVLELQADMARHLYTTGTAIAKSQLENYIEYDAESLYLACLFHDIGCTPENIKK
jgi:HD superfamily phosphodiesterase